MDLAELTVATFDPLVGDAFTIAIEPAAIEPQATSPQAIEQAMANEPESITLVLESATSIGPWPGGRDPFSLVFRGPREPLLAQATYRLEHAALGPLEIFVVPNASDASGTRYEAIFT